MKHLRWIPLIALVVACGCSSPLGLDPDYRARPYDPPGTGAPLGVSAAGPPAADVTPMEDLTLEVARALCLQRNHTVAAAAATVAAAEARIAEARAAFLPTLELAVNRTVNSEVRTIQIAGGASFNLSPEYVTNGLARLNISLFSFGRDWEAVKAARADLTTQVLDERAVKQQLLFEVTQAWYRLHETISQVGVAEDALASAARQLEDANNILEAGRATRDVLLTARVDWLQRQQELLVVQNSVIHARRILNVLLVRAPDAEITLAPAPEHGEVDLEEATLLAWAMEHNPNLLAFRSRRLALEHLRESIERSFAPEVVGSLGADYTSFSEASGYSTNYFALLGLQWNPIEGGRRIGQLQGIHANMVELRERELAAIQQLELDLERAFLDLKETESAVAVARESIEAATENLRIISDQFRAGRTTSREVLDARASLSNSRFTLNRARFLHRTLLAQIEALVGVEASQWLRSGS